MKPVIEFKNHQPNIGPAYDTIHSGIINLGTISLSSTGKGYETRFTLPQLKGFVSESLEQSKRVAETRICAWFDSLSLEENKEK